MTRARFLPEAESELAEAVQFYERAEAGLGDRSRFRLGILKPMSDTLFAASCARA